MKVENICEAKFNEFSIYYNDNLYKNFENFRNEIKKDFNKNDILCVNTKLENKNILSFAYNNLNKYGIELYLKQHFANIVIQKYKLDFLKNNLINLDLLNDYKDIFLKVLMLFDEETDIIDVCKNLKLTEQIFFDEFYYFKLKSLRKRWREICSLTNENSHFFESEELVLELIKFLLNNIKFKNEVLVIKQNNNKIILENENKQILNQINLKDVNISNISNLIIDNFAKQIIISDNINIDNTIINTIVKLFKNQIKFLN